MKKVMATAAAGTFLALIASPASAQSDLHHDPGQDMVGAGLMVDSNPPEPDHQDGDIVSTRVSHGYRRVWIRIHFRELVPTSHLFVNARLQNVNGYTNALKLTTANHPRGLVQLMNLSSQRVIDCAISWNIDYDAYTVVISIPRRCQNNPTRVRVALEDTSVPRDLADYSYNDDSRLIGKFARIAYGLWLHRGPVPGRA
jgi:hypothetical protein